ncbi:MAG: dihydrodipicolinate synthase family protein, partial [Bdellovibrionota bacterium]
ANPKITAIKEATGNVAFSSEIIDALADNQSQMDLLSGDDATFLPLLSIGAVGIISVASNLFPRTMVALQKSCEVSAIKEAMQIHQRFYPLFRDLFIESNPVPIKYVMSKMGWCYSNVRPPLVGLSDENKIKLDSCLKKCGVLKGKPL